MNPLVYTKCVIPHPFLRPYVRFFAFRKFDSGSAFFPKPIIAEHEIIVSFFLRCAAASFQSSDAIIDANKPLKITSFQGKFTAMQTYTKGYVMFQGNTHIVSIHFTPAGFYRIFNISPKEILNRLGDSDEILQSEVYQIVEQLQEQSTEEEVMLVLEKYLIRRMNRQKEKYMQARINAVSIILLKMKGLYPIKKLADDYNLSIQTLEANFTEQIGIDPKSFCCLVRFSNAVNEKLYKPHLNWTNIAHQCGYYDQMHLIKEFRKFTNLSPKQFLNTVSPPVEEFM